MYKLIIRLALLAMIALAIGNVYLSLAPTAFSEVSAQVVFNGDLFESKANPGTYFCACGGGNCAPCAGPQ